MTASSHRPADIADKIAAAPAPAREWTPSPVAELLERIERALRHPVAEHRTTIAE